MPKQFVLEGLDRAREEIDRSLDIPNAAGRVGVHAMTPATSAPFTFDVKTAVPAIQPQRLIGDSLMIEHAEWLQMTVGPFIAPARRSITGEIEYLVEGVECPNGEATAATITRELDALEMSLARVRESLELVMGKTRQDHDISPATTLLSLRMLLDVNLPDPQDATTVHLRGDRLQLSHWGLSTGVPLRQVLLQLNARPSSGYIGSLRQLLSAKYGAQSLDAKERSISHDGGSKWVPKLAIPFPWSLPKRESRERGYVFTREDATLQRMRLVTGRKAMYAMCLIICFMVGLLLGVLLERTDIVGHTWRFLISKVQRTADAVGRSDEGGTP